MKSDYPISDADETMALRLVGWIFSDAGRIDRMLGLTGLDAASLRAGLTDLTTLGALMDFVLDHEPDLLACAEALDVRPAEIAAARARIAG